MMIGIIHYGDCILIIGISLEVLHTHTHAHTHSHTHSRQTELICLLIFSRGGSLSCSPCTADRMDASGGGQIFDLVRAEIPGFGSRTATVAPRRQAKIITQMACARDVIVLGTADNFVCRHILAPQYQGAVDESDFEPVELPHRSGERIDHIFLDPSGYHCIVTLSSGENFYLYTRLHNFRAKKISRFQGIVESIAFDKNGGTDTHTRSFLVGTSVGCVFEVCLDRDGKEKVNNQVFHLDEPLPITSLHFEYVGNMDDANRQLLMTSAAAAGDTRILVLCATTAPSAAPTTSAQGQTPVPSSNTRMYTFYGGPTFAQLFTDVMNRGKASYNDLPGDIKRAELHFYTDKPSQQQPAAARASTKANKQTFALMTEMGIYHGSAKFPSSVSSKRFGTDSVYCNLDESYNVCFYLDVQRLFGRIDGMDVDALCDAVR
jgi:hypothetical protein